MEGMTIQNIKQCSNIAPDSKGNDRGIQGKEEG